MHVLFSISEKELFPCETAISFLDIVIHLKHATSQDQVKDLFFSGGQMKWNEWAKKALQCPSLKVFHVPSLHWGFKEILEQRLLAHVLMCLNWKKCCTSRGSAAKGANFHLSEKLFKNIWCGADVEMGSARHVVPNTSSCKVKVLSPLQGQVIGGIIVALQTYGDKNLTNCAE